MFLAVSQDAAIDSLKALCSKAESDVLKTQGQIDRLQKKLEELKSRYATLKDALEHVSKVSEAPASADGIQDAVDLIIASAGAEGISLKDVQTKLEERRGTKVDSAAVHVAITRLGQKGIIDTDETGSVRIFRRKSITTEAKPVVPEEEESENE